MQTSFVALSVLEPRQARADLSSDELPSIVESGRITFRLAKSRGFCHGVERALRLARETLAVSGSRRVWITSPILHNPHINSELRSGGIRFLSDSPSLWEDLRPDDIVLLPAFGAPPEVRERLARRGCAVVDTTCGSVVFVWKNVDQFVRDGLTVVYHGCALHEEALATLSRLGVKEGEGCTSAPYLVLESLTEAEALASFLRREIDGPTLLAAIPHRSAGFDPCRHLERIGLASQTTMLARETAMIEKVLLAAMESGVGAARARDRFRVQDTICGATQDRQDAVVDLLKSPVNLMIVVGGFNSSNSAHLAELAAQSVPSYHIEGPNDVLSTNAIRHRVAGMPAPIVSSSWLPRGNIVVGLTSGASTPEEIVQSVIARICDVS